MQNMYKIKTPSVVEILNNPVDVALLYSRGPRSSLIKFKLPRYNAHYSGLRGLLVAGDTMPVPNGVRDKNSFHWLAITSRRNRKGHAYGPENRLTCKYLAFLSMKLHVSVFGRK